MSERLIRVTKRINMKRPWMRHQNFLHVPLTILSSLREHAPGTRADTIWSDFIFSISFWAMKHI
jgi:hypothetical protein